MIIYADADAGVYSCMPDDNNGRYVAMVVGVWGSCVKYSYIHFPVGTAPASSLIRKVYLRLRTYTPPADLSVEFRRVYETWSEGTITWNNQPATTPENMYTHLIERDTRYDVTDIFLDALADGVAFGVGVAAIAGTTRNEIAFYTSESSPERRPYIEIEYSYPLFPYQLIFDAAELLGQERKDLLEAEYVKYRAADQWLVTAVDPDCFTQLEPIIDGRSGDRETGWLCQAVEYGKSPCAPLPYWLCPLPTPETIYFRGECSCDLFRETLQPLGIPCSHLIAAMNWYGSTVPYCPYIQCP